MAGINTNTDTIF
ncbi:hypothetical protein D038_1199A, partial [Vibrio parahaemolyticus IDH02189]